MKTIFSISAVLLLLFATSSSVFAFSFNPPDELTGAPGEGNCTQCHAGNALNAAGGSLMLTVPENYLPGEVYDIVVNLSRSGQSRWGFEMTALNSNGARAGTFATADANTQLEEIKSKQYIQHTSTGTAQGKRNANSWTFKWTAPSNNVGPITFYAAGNAANGDFGTAGDYIYTQKVTSDVPPVYGVTLAGVGSLTKSTADASTGITYTLRVTNTGNTNDTIRLSASSSVNATLSRSSVSLAAGASTNVTLTVPGTALTSAGDYAVKVTATSQGKKTKTAEVTATTTILPVYRVTLAGVGNLTRETTDASTGVSYTLHVTNSGNTNDTIRLTTSGDATATVSPASVFLNQGASRTVTLRILGTALTKAGDYAVKVTATSQGNKTKTAEISTTTTILPVYDVSLTGVGSLTTETTDTSAGVTYTLNVTNNGNTDDVINLVASDDDATLSQTSVSLASGASTNVTLTVPGSALATAGEYVVKVTATSQGDSTQTAEVSTTTTILPVYGVTLTGVGDLTTETADASAGVSYTLNVTNNGNTDDMINLATSDDDAILSQTSVSLASGASTNVTLTVPGSALATAGEYVVKVTATSQGDSTKTAEVSTTTTILPVYGVTLTGNNLTKQTKFANAGVSYALQVTNTGNTEDTIVLGSSAEVGIGGSVLGSFRKSKDDDLSTSQSQLEITLAPGASTEVIFTATGDLLTKSGEYKIKVTATSQGDSTKTAEITTTTTILPVYGVTLAGVGNLTTETSDASEGVSYTLTVTNTGNANDVINLAASDDDATLSQSSVSLASGASTNVTLTIPGAALATAGEYVVKVMATSQGDSTKTAEVSTNTTVLPVYGVTLIGENLTKQTQFANAGVSYALQVTNTGNTEDTIILGSSAEVGIGGSVLGSFRRSKDEDLSTSQLEITLAPGASTEVIFTATGDLITKSGEYKIKVTATSQSDTTKTAEVSTTTTILPVYGVTLVGEGALTGSTMDTVEGVTYTLIVTNTGNTEDTIILGSSAEVGIGGSVLGSFSLPDAEKPATSQLEIMLAAGASANVMFTAAGDLLTKPGEYEIKVTATSQSDKTKTAEITTTTTITVVPPVYGVMLESEDELKGATIDALTGISYTLIITNTGNTDDTIVLDSSAGVGIEGSVLGSFSQSDDQVPMGQLEIVLAAGASAEVIFTAAGDFFTKPGEYEIKVIATSQGDSTKTAEITTITTIEPVYGVTLQGEGELKGTTMDMVAGVTYTLIVTNTGNTDDTIILGSSAEVGIGGSVLGSFRLPDAEEPATSQLEIMLAAGASANVMFTAAGDLLTKPGEYEIKVTAASQGDKTKTVEITTTTTITVIPPVYGVMLQGKDELTGATMDILAGVSYTLTVTNTGNTDDTIVLSSSAEVGIEGSVLGSFSQSDDQVPMGQLEIVLSAGASAEVVFTAAGDFFTKPGEYEIKVTATSQGDSTKTAEIITKTTIEPVPWDVNADGTVNIQDLVLVANQFGESGEGLSGDVNMDGDVNILDLVQVSSYFGKSQAEIIQANQ